MIVGIDVGTQSLKVIVTDDALAPRGSLGHTPVAITVIAELSTRASLVE